MNIRQAVLGEVAIHSGAQVSGVDLGTLLRRLLLFDTVIVKSIRLQEIPLLIRAFGRSGFLQLLGSGVLKISRESMSIIIDIARDGVRIVPPCHFTFGRADLTDREKALRSELVSLQGIPGLKNTERVLMEETILTGLVRPPSDYGAQLQAQIEADLRNNTPALKAAIADQLNIQLDESDRPFEVNVEETQSRIFHVKTNLDSVLGTSERKVHEVLQPSVSALANLNQRLAEMAAYSAITGFKDSEAPLLFGKLAGVIATQNPKPLEEQFARVMSIANFPDFIPGRRIDVERLLKARESAECREFRAWLSKLEDISDAQIADMVGGVRNKVASMIQSGSGRTLRLATTTALGLIPGVGLIVGPAAGAVDSFLVERLFPTSGVFAFLSKTYPSLFVSA